MPETQRTYIPREMRLLSEFVAKEYPNDQVFFNLRLGAIRPDLDIAGLSPAEVRMLGVFRRFADAIVIRPDKLIIIEASIRPDPGKLSQLQLYERLVPATPELEPYQGLKIRKLLLWSFLDEVLASIAREQGVVVRVFHPAWVDEYLDSLSPRKRRASKSGFLEQPVGG